MTMEIEVSDEMYDLLKDMKAEKEDTFDDILWRLLRDDTGKLLSFKKNKTDEEVKGFLLKLPASKKAKLKKLAYASGQNVSDYIREKVFNSQQSDSGEVKSPSLSASTPDNKNKGGRPPKQIKPEFLGPDKPKRILKKPEAI